MTDKILIENKETGAMEIKTLTYNIPSYDLGQTVGGSVGDDKFEGEITAIQFKTEIVSGEIITNIYYTIDECIDVDETEIDYYFD